jgi:hypothetical protein
MYRTNIRSRAPGVIVVKLIWISLADGGIHDDGELFPDLRAATQAVVPQRPQPRTAPRQRC